MPVSDGDIGPRRLRAGDAFFKNVTIEGRGRLYFEGVTTESTNNCANQTQPARAYVYCRGGNPLFGLVGPTREFDSTAASTGGKRIWLEIGSTSFRFLQQTTEDRAGTSTSTGSSFYTLMVGGVNVGGSTVQGIQTADLDVGGTLNLYLSISSSAYATHHITRSTDVDSNGKHYLVATTFN